MAKDKTVYVCSNCGQESAKWIGKCPACGQWNTMKEMRVASAASGGFSAGPAAAQAGHALRKNRVLRLSEISSHDDPRIDMHDAELNRVLGGGLVPGSIVLLGGEPGIGKSTLLLQTVLSLAEKKILYVSGEESAHQLKMRAERLLAALPRQTRQPTTSSSSARTRWRPSSTISATFSPTWWSSTPSRPSPPTRWSRARGR